LRLYHELYSKLHITATQEAGLSEQQWLGLA